MDSVSNVCKHREGSGGDPVSQTKAIRFRIAGVATTCRELVRMSMRACVCVRERERERAPERVPERVPEI